jgi:hypothetical protein
MLTERELEKAIKEAHNIAASEAYFEARAGVVYPQPHTIFDGGFSRGWDAGRAPLLERIAELERQLEQARSQMESQKDEWLSWESKRKDMEREAARLNQFLTGDPLTVKMKKSTLMYGPNRESEFPQAFRDAIDAAIQSKEKP